MPYWSLDSTQRDALSRAIRGRQVVDVGAGDCALSRLALDLGAASVIALDKEAAPHGLPPQIQHVRTYFHEWTWTGGEEGFVALCSWPTNAHPVTQAQTIEGAVRIVTAARRVVYIGKNDEETICGWPGLFELFRWRPLLAVHRAAQDLAIYGARRRWRRRVHPLEARSIAVHVFNRSPLPGMGLRLHDPPVGGEE